MGPCRKPKAGEEAQLAKMQRPEGGGQRAKGEAETWRRRAKSKGQRAKGEAERQRQLEWARWALHTGVGWGQALLHFYVTLSSLSWDKGLGYLSKHKGGADGSRTVREEGSFWYVFGVRETDWMRIVEQPEKIQEKQALGNWCWQWFVQMGIICRARKV